MIMGITHKVNTLVPEFSVGNLFDRKALFLCIFCLAISNGNFPGHAIKGLSLHSANRAVSNEKLSDDKWHIK